MNTNEHGSENSRGSVLRWERWHSARLCRDEPVAAATMRMDANRRRGRSQNADEPPRITRMSRMGFIGLVRICVYLRPSVATYCCLRWISSVRLTWKAICSGLTDQPKNCHARPTRMVNGHSILIKESTRCSRCGAMKIVVPPAARMQQTMTRESKYACPLSKYRPAK